MRLKVWSLNEKEFLKFNREGSLYYLTASPRKEGEDEKGDSEIMQVIQKGGKVEVNASKFRRSLIVSVDRRTCDIRM